METYGEAKIWLLFLFRIIPLRCVKVRLSKLKQNLPCDATRLQWQEKISRWTLSHNRQQPSKSVRTQNCSVVFITISMSPMSLRETRWVQELERVSIYKSSCQKQSRILARYLCTFQCSLKGTLFPTHLIKSAFTNATVKSSQDRLAYYMQVPNKNNVSAHTSHFIPPGAHLISSISPKLYGCINT